MSRRLPIALLVALVALALPAAASAAPKVPNVPKIPDIPGLPDDLEGLPKLPKVVMWSGTLDLVGYIEVERTYDFTQECSPGQAWDGVQTLHMETGKPLKIDIRILGKKVVGSMVQSPGNGVVRTAIENYRESNNCEREPAKLDKPECSPRLTGTLTAWLGPAPKTTNATFDDEDLAPLTDPVGLYVGRIDAGYQPDSCPDFGNLEPRAGSVKVATTGETSGAIELPLRNIHRSALADLKAGRTLKDTIRIAGTCDDFVLNPSPLATAATQRDDCKVTARIEVALKRNKK